MTILTGIDDVSLTKLLAGDPPVASVYFNLRATAQSDAFLRWRTIVAGLTEQGAPLATVETLAERVLAAVPGPGVLAAFARGAEVTSTVVLPGAEVPDLSRYGVLPYLRPLLAWEQEHPGRVLAVLDRTGADLSVYAAGSAERVDTAVTGPDDEIERNAPGGWSQGRYQHRAEDSWEHNAAAVADVLARLLQRCGARILLLAGDVRALQYLQDHLPKWIHADVAVRRISGGRSADGSAARLDEQVTAQTHRIVAEQLEELLAEFAAHAGTGGAAVEGPDETLAALAAGRVRVLLLPTGQAQQIRAWFGSGPADVALEPDPLHRAGGQAYEAFLEDVAIRAGLLTGAQIRLVPNGPQAFTIAALCRFVP
ncbi:MULTISPECIES: baeRF2 domain-containing protein [unclassified Kribbella]|uniref:baeRF2 domain-containing protein n=1 Tax=unclassified Kribbella TaxID=2644121 RepID=UPI003017E96E